MPSLDLKFVVHHGVIAKQMMSGTEELVGRDVILIHRLLKNNVEATIGKRPYVLYTDAFVKKSGIDPVKQALTPHAEQIDVIGVVNGWLTDLEAAWQAEESQRRVKVDPAEAVFTFRGHIKAPRPMVWEYLTAPRLRNLWSVGTDRMIEGPADDGKRGAGSVNHCVHGPAAIVEEILDWRPHTYATRRYNMPMPGVPKTIMTCILSDAAGGGTDIEIYLGLDNPADRDAYEQVRSMIESNYNESGARLVQLVESKAKEEMAEERVEPMLPISGGRFLTEPVVRTGTAG